MNKSFVSFSGKNFDNKLPKYQQLINSLLQDIEMGELKPGERLPSINEASEECYLSRDTVERAYTELHKMGAITSIFRKGYFISNSSSKLKTKVMFLVGKITDTNKAIFNSFNEAVGKNVLVDIFTYQYKTRQFQEILGQQLGNYHYYVIMPHLIEEEEENIKCLKKIAGDRLILLDQQFESMQNTHASIVCHPKSQIIQEFTNHTNLFQKYRCLNLVLTEEEYFDAEFINGCGDFCESINMDFKVLDGLDGEELNQGEVYFTLDDSDLIQAIKYADKQNWKLGQDIGIISYNDQGYKEILSGGITVLSNQPEKIGRRAAALIGESYKTTEEIDLELIVRLSL